MKNTFDESEDSEAISKLLKSVRSVKVLTIANQKDNSKIQSNFQNYVNRKNFDEWVSIQAENNYVSILAKQKSDKIKRLMVAVNSEDGENVYVRLKGKFHLNELSESIGTLASKKIKNKSKDFMSATN